MSNQQTRYNDGDANSRKSQLRRAGVTDEPKATELAKSAFEQLPADVQGKLNSVSA